MAKRVARRDSALRLAIKRAGGVSALARALGISHVAVSQWRTTPFRHVFAIEELTLVEREKLRPDIFLRPRPVKKSS